MKKCPFCKVVPSIIYVPNDNKVIFNCKCHRLTINLCELWNELITEKAKEVLKKGNYLLRGSGKGEI